MFIIFCILQTLVQGFGWAVSIWLWTTGAYLPELSSYPLVEFALKTRFVAPAERTAVDTAKPEVETLLEDVEGDRLIRKMLKRQRVIASRVLTRKGAPDGTAGALTSSLSGGRSSVAAAAERVTFVRSRTA
jgi:hypothetical protein